MFRLRSLRPFLRLGLLLVLLSALLAVPAFGQTRQVSAQDGSNGVATLTGDYPITNQDILERSTEPQVVLIDMTAFVKRDKDFPLPSPEQVVAGAEGDVSKDPTYTMQLPIEPTGALNNVSQGKGTGKGVKIFATAWELTTSGRLTAEASVSTGWPNSVASIKADPGTGEVTGGKFIVWSPDSSEMFPTGFGADGKLFTADDPVGPIPAGWTVVDMDQKPFAQIRSAKVTVPIYEGSDAQDDYSSLSYTAAFDALVKDLRTRYVFTDVKKINWDAVVATIRPMIVQAEQTKDKEAFNLAMLKFTTLFHDGHFSVAQDNAGDYFQAQTAGGIGLALGQTDNGEVIARYVIDKMPAQSAGIKPGAQILQFNGKPIAQAVSDQPLLFLSESSPAPTLLQKLRYMTRMPVGANVTIQFQNPGDSSPKSAQLTAIKERDSFAATSFLKGTKPDDTPIIFKVLPSGYGYIKITTFLPDPILMTHQWDWSLQQLQQLGVPGLIIDLRQNFGGWGDVADYFSGSFTKQKFTLNRSYQADPTGKLVYEGADTVYPSPVQWDAPAAILVGPACASACEIMAAGFAHDPSHIVVGSYATAGVEAGVHPWTLPDNLYFQAPIDELQNPDGSVFLEGVGVVPNVKVPVTVQSLLSADDQELPAAEKALDAAVKALATETATEGAAAATSSATPAATISATGAVTPEPTTISTTPIPAAPATAAATIAATPK